MDKQVPTCFQPGRAEKLAGIQPSQTGFQNLWCREGALYTGRLRLNWVVICGIKVVTRQKAAPPWIWGVLHPGPAAAGRPRWWWDKHRSASVVTERTNGLSDCGGGDTKMAKSHVSTHTKTQIHMWGSFSGSRTAKYTFWMKRRQPQYELPSLFLAGQMLCTVERIKMWRSVITISIPADNVNKLQHCFINSTLMKQI